MAILGSSTKLSWNNVATTSLNSLANNGTVDVDIDLNTYRSGGSGSGVFPLLIDIAIDLASFTPTTLAVNIYVLPCIDDTPTDYADEQDSLLVWAAPLTSGASRKKNAILGRNIVGQAGRYFRLRFKNITGVSLASSGNILKVRFPIGDESA
jgi:hypothetical protein